VSKLASIIKNTIFIFGLFLLIACNSNQTQEIQKFDKTNISDTDTIITNKAEFEFNGIWGLTNYFDTIIANKELAKYRLQRPTWFGIIFHIKDSSLISYGSLIEINKKLNIESDTLTFFDSYGGGWDLIKKDTFLILKQKSNQKKVDSSIYIYRKRADLDFMTKNMDKIHKISSNVAKYFNQSLLSGSYQSIKGNKKIIFNPNGKLIGFDKYDTYQIGNYFGTSHPHKNLDVITFSNSKTKKSKCYNWKFNDNILILTEFIEQTIIYNGEKVSSDDYILGSELIKLKHYAQ